MKLIGTSLIGDGRSPATTPTFRAINPATGQAIEPDFHHATAADAAQACALACGAFAMFRDSSGITRAMLLRAIASLLEANSATLVERAILETGLPAARLQGEIGRTVGQLRLFAGVAESGSWLDARIDRAQPDRQPLPKADIRSMLRPLGPVVVFSSSNFPFAFSVAGGDTASALAAGCPVIVKAHHAHPGTSELTAQLVQQAVRDCGLPPGVFSLLFGPGREVGISLVTNPHVRAVGFTGSTSGGRALMDAAAARPDPIPVYAEMGSVNPVFLLPGALAARASAIANGLHASLTLGVGQFCTNPGLVFAVDGPDCETFLAALAAPVTATAPGVMLTPTICQAYRDGLARTGGTAGVVQVAAADTSADAPGALGGAAVFATDLGTFLDRPALLEEMFGPATLVVRCPDAAAFARAAAALPGQLTATIHAAEGELAAHAQLVSLCEAIAGRVVINGFPTGVEVCHAMNHGGPYPATSDGRSTSVGTRAITRFARPVCYQDFPQAALPDALKDHNPLGLHRLEC